MALRGTIPAFGLGDVLGLLASTHQTGYFQVHGDGAHGHAWLRDGVVVTAASGRASGDTAEALADLLCLATGEFTFEPRPDGPDSGTTADAVPLPALLLEAATLRKEWDELLRLCPTRHHEIRLADGLPAGHVTITADLWPAVVALGSPRTLDQLATTFDLGELDALRIVSQLHDLGLVELHATTAPSTNGRLPAAT